MTSAPDDRTRVRTGTRARVAVAVTVLALVAAASAAAVSYRSAAPQSVYGVPRPTPSTVAVVGLIDAALALQGIALRTGDEAAWLSVVDPADERLAQTHRTRFRVLREMLAADWVARPLGVPVATGPGGWDVTIVARFCLGVRSCAAARPANGPTPAEAFTAVTSWRLDADGAVLTAETPTSDERSGSSAYAPWVAGALVVSVGPRVVVAAAPDLRDRLPDVLAAGERAASNADSFLPGAHPGRYIVYLAGREQWRTWFGGGLPEWATAYAPPTSHTHRAVIVNLGGISERGLDSALRHELGHVVTMGDVSSAAVPFWMAEGIAEWIDQAHRPATAHPYVGPARRYLRDVGLPELETLTPGMDDPQWRVSGQYGLAYLAIRYLADSYGAAAVLEFLSARKRGLPLAESSKAAFAVAWPSVESDITVYYGTLLAP